MTLTYTLKYKAGNETFDVTAVKAQRLAKAYAARTVVFRGKEHLVRSGLFDPTRGFVLTNSHGKKFLFAEIVETKEADDALVKEPPEVNSRSVQKRHAARQAQIEARDEADLRVRVERKVIREARELAGIDAALRLSDARFVAYLARLGLQHLREKKGEK